MSKDKKKAPKAKQAKERVVDPIDLAIHETTSGMQLWFHDQPILLRNGVPLTHRRLTLIEHIREEFSGFGTVTLDAAGRVLKPDMISSYLLLGVQQSIEASLDHPFVSGFGKWLLLDQCLSRCAGPEQADQLARWLPLTRYYEANGINPPDFAQISVDVGEDDDVESILRQRIESMMDLDSPEADDFFRYSKVFVEKVNSLFTRLGPEEWAVMYYLFRCNHGVLFPLLLVSGRCTAQEYANGLMAAHLLLLAAESNLSRKGYEAIAHGYREDAQVVLQYLQHARSPWAKEILEGEDDTREFKETLRYDIKTQQFNKELEHSVLKNVAGFLNCNGGTIFVGVADKGAITGIAPDGFESNDKWWLHLFNRIGQQIGKRFLLLCSVEFDQLHGKDVSRITVRPSNEPAYLNEIALKKNGSKDAYYIRGGAAAHKLSPEDTAKHIAERFHSTPTPPPAE